LTSNGWTRRQIVRERDEDQAAVLPAGWLTMLNWAGLPMRNFARSCQRTPDRVASSELQQPFEEVGTDLVAGLAVGFAFGGPIGAIAGPGCHAGPVLACR
jgi:hypothetical protein